MKVHDLKTWPDPFQQVWDRNKTAEFRRDDRWFAVGDQLRLNEWKPSEGRYTGRQVTATVTHIVRGGVFGIPDGYAMLSLGGVECWFVGRVGPGAGTPVRDTPRSAKEGGAG